MFRSENLLILVHNFNPELPEGQDKKGNIINEQRYFIHKKKIILKKIKRFGILNLREIHMV